jgi:hypothetical protein
MLRREPTRLELKSEDMKEYDEILAERRAAKSKSPVPAPQPEPQPNERHDRIGFKGPGTTNK